jgi:sugar (pentulose or hexulose) kinase
MALDSGLDLFGNPGWGEQNIGQRNASLADSIKKALRSSKVPPEPVKGVGVDGTSCTVVFLDKNGRPLRDAVMWYNKSAATIFEHADWLVYRLTGEITANANTTSIRWFYNYREGGMPRSMYDAIGPLG